jgi:hypothetical protein
LVFLRIDNNPLNLSAFCTDIPEIENINPGINLLVSPNPFPSCNTAPVVDAGLNLEISSEDQSSTVIQGNATDAEGDLLTYRWLAGATELSADQPVGAGGEADLDLSPLTLFSTGQHTLTLEVSDGQEIATDDMILTVGNSAPSAAPTGGGTFQIGTPIILGGQVSDFDGELLTYEWLESGVILFTGTVQTTFGGAPGNLPQHIKSDIGLGLHVVTLILDDGINEPISSDIEIEVIDTTEPTLALIPDQTILWPPNHKMVDVLIDVNAQDNSGNSVLLTTAVSSNEPLDDLGDGSTEPDFTVPTINQLSGQITLQLRAERSGNGDGRVYTIAVTGTDSSGNSSEAFVEILVPHKK